MHTYLIPGSWLRTICSLHITMSGLRRTYLFFFHQSSITCACCTLPSKINISENPHDIVCPGSGTLEDHAVLSITCLQYRYAYTAAAVDEFVRVFVFLAPPFFRVVVGAKADIYWRHQEKGHHLSPSSCRDAYYWSMYARVCVRTRGFFVDTAVGQCQCKGKQMSAVICSSSIGDLNFREE